jgi:hypothetical protein
MATLAPPPLPAEVARPLVAAAEQVARLRPWTFMCDTDLVGVRDERTGELRVASVLGALKKVFAVVLYRGASGLGWLHDVATTDEESNYQLAFESMDCIRVDWMPKGKLYPYELELLSAGGFKPTGRGAAWPRFQNCVPGWHPWFVSEVEARQLTDDLLKVARFASFFADHPSLYADRQRGEVPIVSRGDRPLAAAELDWTPLVPPPLPAPEPVTLSAEEVAELEALPESSDAVFEFAAPLMPEMTFIDGTERRPCFARAALFIDRDSFFIFATEISHGTTPLGRAVRQTLIKGLREAGLRPSVLLVEDPRLATVLGPACAAIGVPVRTVATLVAASDCLGEMAKYFGKPRR